MGLNLITPGTKNQWWFLAEAWLALNPVPPTAREAIFHVPDAPNARGGGSGRRGGVHRVGVQAWGQSRGLHQPDRRGHSPGGGSSSGGRREPAVAGDRTLDDPRSARQRDGQAPISNSPEASVSVHRTTVYAVTEDTLYSVDPGSMAVKTLAQFTGWGTLSDGGLDNTDHGRGGERGGTSLRNTDHPTRRRSRRPRTVTLIEVAPILAGGSASDTFYASSASHLRGGVPSGPTRTSSAGTRRGSSGRSTRRPGAAQDLGNFGVDPGSMTNQLHGAVGGRRLLREQRHEPDLPGAGDDPLLHAAVGEVPERLSEVRQDQRSSSPRST